MKERPDREYWKQQRFAAESKEFLQGLTRIPLGGFFYLMAAGEAGWWQGYPLLELLGAFVLCVIIRQCYWRLSIYVEEPLPPSDRHHPRTILTDIAKFALIVVVWSTGAALDLFFRLPVSFTGLVLASLLMLWWYLAAGRGGHYWAMRHYWAMATLVIGVSLMPLLGLLSPQFFDEPGILYAAFATILTVSGILDHLILHRYTKCEL